MLQGESQPEPTERIMQCAQYSLLSTIAVIFTESVLVHSHTRYASRPHETGVSYVRLIKLTAHPQLS